MIDKPPANASIPAMRRQIERLTEALNALSGSMVPEASAAGGEGQSLAAGMIRVPAREKQTWIKALVTDRRMVGGGAVSGNISPGESVEYKVTPLDTGLESDWIEPRRKFDTDTIGFIPAPVDDPEGTRSYAFVSRFPAGDGTYDLVLDVQEKLHGQTCVEAE